MKGVLRHALLSCLLLLAVSSPALGAGFGLYEFGARANALGGTLVARADDPSALVFNPAGITQLNGTQIMAGVTAIGPNARIKVRKGTNNWDTTGHDNVWYPPHFYVTHQVNDDLYLGMGVFSRFGLGTEHDESWPGRYNVYQVQLETLSFNPNIAYKLTDKLSVAAGVEFMHFSLDRWSKIDGNAFTGAGAAYDPTTYGADIDEHQSADSWGVGGNLGLHYKIDDQWSLGLSYRSQIRQELGGTVSYTDPNNVSALLGGALFNEVGISGKIILPDMIFMGVCYKPFENLSMEFSAIHSRWSSYDAYTIEYESRAALGRNEISSIKNWNDVWRYQFGVEYTPLSWLDLRASYLYDESPIPVSNADYMLPTNDRQMVGLGVGLRYDNWQLDLSYNYLWMTDREVASDGRTRLNSEFYDAHSHMGGVSVTYKF